MTDKHVNIDDVARDAGVSTATVSRVLNNPDMVSPDTRGRVLASINKLGYKPNVRAQMLARGSSKTICFLLCNRPFMHSVHSRVLQGVATETGKLGVQVVYASCDYSADMRPESIELPGIVVSRGLIDGVILAGTNYPNMLRALSVRGIPYVLFGTNLVGGEQQRIQNAVYVDEVGGGYEVTKHLMSLGHRDIWFLGDTSLPWYRRRYQGYAKAMSEGGLQAHPPFGHAWDGELAMGVSACKDLLEYTNKVTAIFAGADLLAIGAMRVLRSNGISVPDDVSIAGFNDEDAAEIAEPSLTTVHIPTEEAGAACADMLSQKLLAPGTDFDPLVLPTELVVRDSTARVRDFITTD